MKSQRHATCVIAILIFFAIAEQRGYGEPGLVQDSQDDRLILGFTRNLFADVNIPDALAAMKIWATEIKKQRGFKGPAKTKVFDDINSVLRTVKDNQVDLVILGALDYLEIQHQVSLEPHFVAQRGEKVTDQILLLVHGKSGFRNLGDLKQKDLILLDDARSNIGKIWLETLVFERDYASLNNFFGDVKITEKPSRAVLPIFFRQTEAGLIHRAAFEMMAELNPQLQKDLIILASSPDTIPSVSCIRQGYNPVLKEALVDAMKSLHEQPRGQQILMLFREEKLVPFKESYLDSINQLLRRHRALSAGVEKN